MKKKAALFTLASVTAISACGLVIDPDKLVDGNGASPDNAEAGPDSTNGDIDAGTDTGVSDTGIDGNIVVEVPECVPKPPSTTGAQGPYAVVTGPKGTSVSCPPGYLPTPVAQGDGSLQAPAVECASATGCTCGTGSGTPKCGLRVRYFDDAACTVESGTPTTVGGFTNCTGLASRTHLKLETTVSNVTCPASGSTTPSKKTPAEFATTTVVCAPDPNVKVALCKGEDIPLPPSKDARACIIVPMNASCSSGSYASSVLLSKAGAFDDTRACTCGCVGDPVASCTGGSAETWGGFNFTCTGAGATALPAGTCRVRGNDGLVSADEPPTAGGSGACIARGVPSGTATAKNDLKLCCLGSGGGDGS